MMRDRLVYGINEERWQKRLLAEPNLTYKSIYASKPDHKALQLV